VKIYVKTIPVYLTVSDSILSCSGLDRPRVSQHCRMDTIHLLATRNQALVVEIGSESVLPDKQYETRLDMQYKITDQHHTAINTGTGTVTERVKQANKLDYINSPAHCCITQPPVAPSGDSASHSVNYVAPSGDCKRVIS